MNLLGERTISSIPVMPLAMMLGVISAIIGLIIGIFYALVFGTIISTFPTNSPTTPEYFNLNMFSVLFGVGAIIIMPIIGFIGGLIQGVIVAVLYNFLAPRIGGVKLRFKEQTNQHHNN